MTTTTKTKETRVEATARVTAVAESWLWHRRGARAIADEIEFGRSMRRPVSWGDVRVDLLAATWLRKRKIPAWRIDVVEVKGSAADARREDYGQGRSVRNDRRNQWQELGSKWWEAGIIPDPVANYWLFLDISIPEKCYRDLPKAWGIVLVEGYTPHLHRMPVRPGEVHSLASRYGNVTCDDTRAAPFLAALAQRQTKSRFPTMAYSSVAKAAEAIYNQKGRP